MIDPTTLTTSGSLLSADVQFRSLCERLRDAAVWGADWTQPVKVIETHISVVFVVAGSAYKIKKPVRFWGLVDYSTQASRLRYCLAEVKLNRRLAPEIYLGVVALVPESDAKPGALRHIPIESEDDLPEDVAPEDVVVYAVHMRQYAEHATLKSLVKHRIASPVALRDLAEQIAEFHRNTRLEERECASATPSAIADVFRRNLKGTAAHVPDVFPEIAHDGLAMRLRRRLWSSRHAIRRRIKENRIVNGHGDMRLEHVVRHFGRSAIVDCVEFTEALRHIDALSDIAFLSMDLTHHGRRDLADVLEDHYLTETGDLDGAQLLPLFRAYRAHVRACVHVARAQQVGTDTPEGRVAVHHAQQHLALAWSFVRGGSAAPLILMMGLSGTGKSVVARTLAIPLRAEIFQSDAIRKELAGLAPTQRVEGESRDALYSDVMSAGTYNEMHIRARNALQRGDGAILDATHIRHDARMRAFQLAESEGAPFAIVYVDCPPDEVHKRLKERQMRDDDVSDADEHVYESQRTRLEALTEDEQRMTVTLTPNDDPLDALMPILACLEGQLDARSERLGRDGPRAPHKTSFA